MLKQLIKINLILCLRYKNRGNVLEHSTDSKLPKLLQKGDALENLQKSNDIFSEDKWHERLNLN
ncbi:MAG: hypothetical protein E6L01_03385 [Thaumarchaeota archaeon]|nr:MAG: hypothetical protein E6L01_03385 [Nitrososphaerota archaeon]